MLSARVIGVGNFHTDLTDILLHAPTYYENTGPGTLVEAEVFLCGHPRAIPGMAECLGVEITDCSTHAIQPIVADTQGLIRLFGEDEVDKFIRLVAADFTLLFSFR